MIKPYPLILKPSYKHYIWGGRRIVELFNRIAPEQIYAESWEASDREEGMSLIENGPLKGLSLREVLLDYPDFMTLSPINRFPLLIKLIDAHKPLSIQVHPNDQNAFHFGGEAKSEMWHVLEADEGSLIYLGLKQNLSEAQIKQAILDKNLEAYMHQVPVQTGQTFYIPGGLLHSIGKGCLIYEVQQNSNTTYRLYDWGRVDDLGQSRPLHIEKALKVMLSDQQILAHKVPKVLLQKEGVTQTNLLKCPYFEFNKWEISQSVTLDPQNCFRVFFIREGNLTLEDHNTSHTLEKGQTFMVPPKYGTLKMTSNRENCSLLETIPACL